MWDLRSNFMGQNKQELYIDICLNLVSLSAFLAICVFYKIGHNYLTV